MKTDTPFVSYSIITRPLLDNYSIISGEILVARPNGPVDSEHRLSTQYQWLSSRDKKDDECSHGALQRLDFGADGALWEQRAKRREVPRRKGSGLIGLR